MKKEKAKMAAPKKEKKKKVVRRNSCSRSENEFQLKWLSIITQCSFTNQLKSMWKIIPS